MPAPPEFLLSIHDVMPDRLDRVERLLERIGTAPVYLLVVPGLDWRAPDIERLRGFVEAGHRLAGHGWVHRIERYGGLRHRVHAMLISRCVAEHLERDGDGILALMQRCRAWFPAHDLPTPDYYVPPAWALGRVALERLSLTGFSAVETLTGIALRTDDTGGDPWTFRRLPLVGFEADTLGRQLAVGISNRLNRGLSRLRGPLRFGLHPDDLSLRLATDIERMLASDWRPSTLDAVLPPRSPTR